MKPSVGFVLLLHLFGSVIATKDVAEAYFNGLASTEKSPYINWLNDNFGTTYSQHSFLTTSSASGSGAAVFWKIVEDDIHFAVAARAAGWLAFGISEAGGMLGSDVVYYETGNPDQLVDSYILESRATPLKDDCQNWNLISKTISDGWLILEVSRKLDTGDNQDHKIMNDAGGFVAPTRLIAAWGDTPTLSFHGTNAARNSVRLFANDSVGVAAGLANQLTNAAAGFFDVTENNAEIPARDTTYIEVCRSADDILQEIGVSETPLTIIGGLPVITEETRAFVHHFTVYSQRGCNRNTFDKSMIFGWAPGDEGWALPEHVGFPIFESNNRNAISVEIHYNNPDLVSGQIDSSGVRFFYVNGERDERAGILELGDPALSLGGEKINNGLTQYDFSCPGVCSAVVLQQESVTVLSEYLHMHQTGVRMTNQVIRNNDIVHTSKVDVFDFDQQGSFFVQQEPYEVKPGDTFRTSCYYRDGAEFGTSSQEEMCIAFVMYYPAKAAAGIPWICPYGFQIPFCSQELERSDLEDVQGLDRVFGSSNGECETTTDVDPTMKPTLAPISTGEPTVAPTIATLEPTIAPISTGEPTVAPTIATLEPTVAPISTGEPTVAPTSAGEPTVAPTIATLEPTVAPISTGEPTAAPTSAGEPTVAPTIATLEPTVAQIRTGVPTVAPQSAGEPPLAPISTGEPTLAPTSVGDGASKKSSGERGGTKSVFFATIFSSSFLLLTGGV